MKRRVSALALLALLLSMPRLATALTFPGCQHPTVRKAAILMSAKVSAEWWQSKKWPPPPKFSTSEKIYEPYLEPWLDNMEPWRATYVRGFMNAHWFSWDDGNTLAFKGNTDNFDLAVCMFEAAAVPNKVEDLVFKREVTMSQFTVDRRKAGEHEARFALKDPGSFNLVFVVPKGVVSKADYQYRMLKKGAK
jgi:hypothetical protein